MKKIMNMVLCAVLMVSLLLSAGVFEVSAGNPEDDFWVEDGVLLGYYGKDIDVVIPGDMGITVIGRLAFYKSEKIRSVTIPEDVSIIEDRAFLYCPKLQNITLPDSLAVIEILAFSECESLIEITIPDRVSVIGEWAFNWCNSLTNIHVGEKNTVYTSIDGVLFNKEKTTLLKYPAGKSQTAYTVPDGIVNIGERAFLGCGWLQSVVLPDSVTDIGSSAFSECSALTDIRFADALVRIGQRAFSLCYDLLDVTIPASVTEIGYDAFMFCRSLTAFTVDAGNTAYSAVDGVLFDAGEKILIQYPIGKALDTYTAPEGVEVIGISAFEGCELRVIILPDSVLAIKTYAFSFCDHLEEVILSNQVQSIESRAFLYCRNLKTLYIPPSVTDIGYDLFYDWLWDLFWNELIIPVVTGELGSYAETYFWENDIPFLPVPGDFLWGDVDRQNGLDISDARMVLQYLVGKITLTPTQLSLANVDGKNGVTITDARLMLQRLVSKIDRLPVQNLF
ncbi:MAG: leucine-rich repeat protein [Oscillospiraceae bacterium]|nr:leucine-rich repeat protein [Oscillospiraceae bacterium]